MINATTTIGVTFLCLSLMSIAPLHVCVNCITRYSTPNTLNTSSFFVNHFFKKMNPFKKGSSFIRSLQNHIVLKGLQLKPFAVNFLPLLLISKQRKLV